MVETDCDGLCANAIAEHIRHFHHIKYTWLFGITCVHSAQCCITRKCVFLSFSFHFFFFFLVTENSTANDVYYVYFCVPCAILLTTLYLYNKYCLSVRYENDCNEKRGWYLLLPFGLNDVIGSKTDTDGRNLLAIYFVEHNWIVRMVLCIQHERVVVKKSSNFYSMCFEASSVIKYGNLYTANGWTNKRMKTKLKISTISLIFFHCNHINCSTDASCLPPSHPKVFSNKQFESMFYEHLYSSRFRVVRVIFRPPRINDVLSSQRSATFFSFSRFILFELIGYCCLAFCYVYNAALMSRCFVLSVPYLCMFVSLVIWIHSNHFLFHFFLVITTCFRVCFFLCTEINCTCIKLFY